MSSCNLVQALFLGTTLVLASGCGQKADSTDDGSDNNLNNNSSNNNGEDNSEDGNNNNNSASNNNTSNNNTNNGTRTPQCGCNACPEDGQTYLDICGSVTALGQVSNAGLFVSPVDPMSALLSQEPEMLQPSLTDENGNFAFCCVDITDIMLGIVIAVDDNPAVDSELFLTTATGVKGWETDEDKLAASLVGVTGATAMAVPNQLVAVLNALTGKSGDDVIEKTGFVLGMVVDSQRQPVEGATVISTDPSFTQPIVFPAADFSSLQSTTSANGLWLVPEPVGLKEYTAQKEGMVFSTAKAASKAGFSYFSIIVGQ